MSEKLQKSVQSLPEAYIKVSWPGGITEVQRTEITLAFYAGIMSMFSMLNDIGASIDDENSAGVAVGMFVEAVKDEAIRLNNSTTSRFKHRVSQN